DSSHGKAIVTPAPARTVRREMRLADFFIRSGISFTFLFWGICLSFIYELRAGDYRLHQSREAVIIRGQHISHALNGGFIGEQQRPVQRICQQFPSEIVNEILFAMLPDISLHALEALALAAAGKDRSNIDRPSRQIFRPPLTD